MRWVGYVAGKVRNVYKILFENSLGKRSLKDLDIDGRITLKWALKEAMN
jgi:hypothetical protein